MPPARVVAVAPGSPAASTGIQPGDEVLSLNGEAVRDVIRYQIQADEPVVELELRRGGLEQLTVVEKAAGAPLGLELASPVFDRVQTCDNHCPFCFIHQLPKGMRRSLYLKDDDYRLSFLYGNFTTLTRFTEADLERVISERLSPLYVSIHATDPDMRAQLLRNRRGATSLRWLAALLDAGIDVHGQIVVCPGVNDAPPDGYRAPRAAVQPITSPAESATAGNIAIVTGEYGEQVLAPLLPALRDAAGVPVRLVAVPNRF